MNMSRRNFIGASAAAVVVAGTKAAGPVFGANDRIRVGVVGIHGQGGAHIRDYMEQSDAEIAALCDVDARVLEGRIKGVEKETGKAPKGYGDIRDLLEDKSIDAISIATPNHWHSLAAVWGCMAGKDVYVEKPLSHTIWEGEQLVKAAKKYDRVVQHGTQSRSDPTLRRDIALIHEGFIGDIVHSRGYVYKNGNRYAIGHGSPADPPEYLNWDLWQGPAHKSPYLAKEDGEGLQVHYNWHWFWDYGNGEIGNQGVHEMDIACWGHNRGLPIRVASTGGRYAWDDDGDTPNTQATQYTYPDGSMLTFEVRNLGSFHEADGGACGNSFFGTDGYYVRSKGFFDYQNKRIPVGGELPPTRGRIGNFLTAVRTRKPEDNLAPVEKGALSCVHIHMGTAAYRLQRDLRFNPETARFIDDDDANAMVKRDYRAEFAVPEIA